MDLTATSFESLIQKVVNPQYKQLKNVAIETFCKKIIDEPDGIQNASKVLASWIHSSIEWEALQTLTLLDICMRRCGPLFTSEIGKFRFLNEMIKLVSPKYLGNSTPISIRQKVLNLFEAWIAGYPHEIKIKEAFQMLEKQGVVKNSSTSADYCLTNMNISGKHKNSIFDDEEKSKLLRKLLQSKDANDIHAANKLIKTMFKENENRIQQDKRREMELESVHNNVKLLSEMLDCYIPVQTKKEDIELMKELYESCERLQPTINKLAEETQDDDLLVKIIEASKDLENVRNKYVQVLLLNQSHIQPSLSADSDISLLDLAIPNVSTSCEFDSPYGKEDDSTANSQNDFELLKDIFGTLDNYAERICLNDQPLKTEVCVMKPMEIAHAKKNGNDEILFQSCNELSELLFKNNPSNVKDNGQIQKPSNNVLKTSLNLIKQSDIQTLKHKNFNSNFITDERNQFSINSNSKTLKDTDDLICDSEIFTNNVSSNQTHAVEYKQEKVNIVDPIVKKDPCTVKLLDNISISLENITPGTIPPITVIDNRNNVTVVFNFAKDSPGPDISVIVITTISKNCKPLKNYLFEAVVPDMCKCKLQPPSETELLAHNPFLPPPAITQIMLIANPQKESISLKFVLSYTMNGEKVTEIGEVNRLPII